MKRRIVRSFGAVIVTFVAVVLMIVGGLFLVSLDTETHPDKIADSHTGFPKQDCCVPSTDLKGTWNFLNENGSSFVATVKEDSIEILLVTSGNTSMIYWTGTFESYKPAGSTIISNLAEGANSRAILSRSKSKNFFVGDTTLQFDFTAMGATTSVKMNRV